MKTKRKSKWNFEHINWDEFMSKQFLTIYNLDKKPCSNNSCKRNCYDNLFCINKLGESKWCCKANKANDIDEKYPPNSDTNFAAGLKNYGNTCYFNSLLQVYFNIAELKEAVFRFPVEDIPDEIISYLQTIFAQMQLSVHKTVDPVELINALELPQLEQQDAPEFHSLFMNLVDQRFSLIDDHVIRSLIGGTIGYLTRCKGCGYESQIDCQFREIDLKPMASFDQALSDFLKVELLTDDNKYDCSSCLRKCDGERQTVLQKLPPLLCFQFLRYSYDNTGTKKKNCSNVGFSSHLSMDNYINRRKKDDSNKYIIKAILIHIGLQPTSGHYQALIHTSSQDWILYDDLNVHKLDSIDDVKKILGQKKPVVNKTDSLSSRKHFKDNNGSVNFVSSNAYMVFYERQDVFNNHSGAMSSVEVPSHLKGNIQMRNETYLFELESQRKEKLENQEKLLKESETITEAYEKLILSKSNADLVSISNEFEFLPTSWLTKWLTSGQRIVSDGSDQADDIGEWKSLQCRHDMLGPDIALSHIKIVDSTGVDFLIDNQFLPKHYKRRRLTDLCQRCWRLKFEIKKFENISKNDLQIDNCLKSPPIDNLSDQNCYWISKSHLRQWRKIIRLAIETKFNDLPDNQDESNSGSSSVKELPHILNSDLLCSHNNLSIDASKRILITENIWNKILSYFPKPSMDSDERQFVEFAFNADKLQCCSDCCNQLADVIQKSDDERTHFSKILNSKKRFEYNGNDQKLSCLVPSQVEFESVNGDLLLYLVPTSFITQWKRFIKNPSVDTRLREIDYSDVFCHHGTLLSKDWYHLVENESLYILWPSEWERFSACYAEIEFHKISVKVDDKFISDPQLLSSVQVCDVCYEEWNALQSKFENSVIYIRLISNKEDESAEAVDEAPPKKKAKTNIVADPNVTDCNVIRRSARSKRHRNDTTLKISSNDTIKDIKLKLMNIYSVSPIDQHLIFNELELIDGSSTISKVGIKPASILYLILDTELINHVETANGNLETGFSGTKLMQSMR